MIVVVRFNSYTIIERYLEDRSEQQEHQIIHEVDGEEHHLKQEQQDVVSGGEKSETEFAHDLKELETRQYVPQQPSDRRAGAWEQS